ncbi:RNA polymerase sigma factor [Colwelliaceae bacterium 6441]
MPNYLGFKKEVSNKVIKQAQAGDINALEIIYKTYAAACYALAFRISCDKSLSQDVVHDAFIKIMEKISSLKDFSLLVPWIKKIVSNETINQLKRRNRIEFLDEDTEKSLITNDLFDQHWLATCKDLNKLLSNLSDTSRIVLVLHEIEGFNHKEIANVFNKTESFSKVTLSRAYKALKKNSITEGEIL